MLPLSKDRKSQVFSRLAPPNKTGQQLGANPERTEAKYWTRTRLVSVQRRKRQLNEPELVKYASQRQAVRGRCDVEKNP